MTGFFKCSICEHYVYGEEWNGTHHLEANSKPCGGVFQESLGPLERPDPWIWEVELACRAKNAAHRGYTFEQLRETESRLAHHIDKDEFDAAKLMLAELSKMLRSDDPELVRYSTLISFLEFE